MKALVAKAYSGIGGLAFDSRPVPEPKPSEMLVEVQAVGLNPLDVKLVRGDLQQIMPLQFPFVPGTDCVGKVIALGDAVTGFRLGDTVCAMTPQFGALAEFAIVDTSAKTAKVPDQVAPTLAAAIPEAGLTAVTVLRAAQRSDKPTMAVIGAGGGVGMFLVQLASRQGFTVIATCRESDEDRMKEYGAAEVVLYDKEDVRREITKRYPAGVDILIDMVHQGESLLASAGCVQPGGQLISTLFGPASDAFGDAVTVTYVQVSPEQGELDDLLAKAASGELKIDVTESPFADATDALESLQRGGMKGKLVLRM